MEETEMTPPVPMHSGKLKMGIMGGALLLGGLFVAGYLPRLHNRSELVAQVEAVSQIIPIVAVVQPTVASSSELTLPGSIQPIEETIINARTAGYLRRWYVDIGSRVKKGQVLAEIESPEVVQQAAQAVAESAKSQAGVQQAASDVVRSQANVAAVASERFRLLSIAKQTKSNVARNDAKVAQARAARANAVAKEAQGQRIIESRKADVVLAQSRLTIADKTVKRWRTLASQGAVAAQDLDEREAAYSGAEATLRAAQSAVSEAEADALAAKEAVRAADADIAAAQAEAATMREALRAAILGLRGNTAAMDAARATVQAGRSNVHAAEATTNASQSNVSRYNILRGFQTITAPFDGVITSRNAEVGALISAGGASSSENTASGRGLFGLAKVDRLRIQVRVPQSSIQSIKPGDTANVTVRELPGRTFVGRVFQTAGALDAATRTLLTEIHLNNADGVLKAGTYADVTFTKAEVKSTLRIPATALISGTDGTKIATLAPDKTVHFQPIQVSRDYGNEIEITNGLTKEVKVITNPNEDLVEGGKVEVTAVSPPSRKP